VINSFEIFKGAGMRILLIVLLAWFSGCHRLPRYERPSEAAHSTDSRVECQEVIEALLALSSFRALANTTVIYDGSVTSFRYVVIGKGVDKFRIDLLPDGGSYTIGMLVVDGDETILLNSQEKTFARSSDEQKLVKSFLGLEGITRPAVIGLLSGHLPPVSCDGVRLYRQVDSLVLEDSIHGLVWYLSKDAQRVVRLLGLNDSRDRIVFEGQRVTKDDTGQGRVDLEVHSPAHVKVAIELERVGVNVSVADALFTVQIPSNFRDVSE
jgi:hypothetical protein